MVVRSRSSRILRTVAGWAVVALFAFPLYYWLTVAFKDGNEIFNWPPKIFSFSPTVKNFEEVFGISLGFGFGEQREVLPGGGNWRMGPRLWDSIVIAVLSTALAVTIATLASYALSRMHFRGRHHFVSWVLSTRMMPPVAVAIPVFFIYKDLSLLDTYTGVILIHALMNLPLVKGGLAAAGVLCFIFSWTEFLISLQLTTSIRTIPVKITTFVTSTGTEWGLITALGSAALVPSFIFIMLVQKHLVRGLTLGSLKD